MGACGRRGEERRKEGKESEERRGARGRARGGCEWEQRGEERVTCEDAACPPDVRSEAVAGAPEEQLWGPVPPRENLRDRGMRGVVWG